MLGLCDIFELRATRKLTWQCRSRGRLELPVRLVLYGLDGPVELLAKRFGEELLEWDLELVGEDDSQARIDIVLQGVSMSIIRGSVSEFG